MDNLKVFIGSSDYNFIEQQVLIHTLKKHASKEVEIFILDCSNFKILKTDGKKREIVKDLSEYKDRLNFVTNFSWSR